MARQRTTFGKLQRAADKQAKARAKQERRQERKDGSGDEDEPTVAPAVDQAALLDEFAALHTAFEDGQIPRDEFESRRELLASQMVID